MTSRDERSKRLIQKLARLAACPGATPAEREVALQRIREIFARDADSQLTVR